jgi:hypothetical protein
VCPDRLSAPTPQRGVCGAGGSDRTPNCYVRIVSHSAIFAKLFKDRCAFGPQMEFAARHLENPLDVREIESFVKMKISFTFTVTWGRRTIHTSPEVLAPRGARLLSRDFRGTYVPCAGQALRGDFNAYVPVLRRLDETYGGMRRFRAIHPTDVVEMHRVRPCAL